MPEIGIVGIITAGLLTGGLSCFAVQGGLLASVIGRVKEEGVALSPWKMSVAFVVGKLAIYTLLGAILGLVGSVFSLDFRIQGIIQMLVALYLVGIGLHFLNVHPIFRYFLIQPPQFLMRYVRRVSKGDDAWVTPAFLGVMTVFIPCGTTLAMMALAVTSGNPVWGALIMALFVISSSWVFFVLGAFSHQAQRLMSGWFYKFTGVVLVGLALYTFNGGLNLMGSPYSFEALTQPPVDEGAVAGAQTTASGYPVQMETNVQYVTIDVTRKGYEASVPVLKKGIPVVLTLKTNGNYTCANAFTIPSMNVSTLLQPTDEQVIRFTPEKSGRLPYSCSMGMYRGEFKVI